MALGGVECGEERAQGGVGGAEAAVPTAAPTPLYAVGTEVLVKRSSGDESEGTIETYDARRKLFTVKLDGGGSKRVTADQMRPQPLHGGSGAGYPIGSVVLVKRSSGDETMATVVKVYDERRDLYLLSLAGGGLKQATSKQLRRPAPAPEEALPAAAAPPAAVEELPPPPAPQLPLATKLPQYSSDNGDKGDKGDEDEEVTYFV